MDQKEALLSGGDAENNQPLKTFQKNTLLNGRRYGSSWSKRIRLEDFLPSRVK
jgi:hypothetical protein